jgi:hypothetical protein
MKKSISLALLALALPVLALAQDAKKQAPDKGTLSSYRIWAKAGHEEALKSALTAHAAKFHTTWKWRVYEVLSGPDAGAYMISEGPASWTDIESRGDLGAEHNKDYSTTVQPHVEKSTGDTYATYEAECSTVAGGAFSTTKVLIRHLYYKPGRSVQTVAMLRQWKQIFAKLGLNVAVWRSFYSGESQFMIADRLKKGFNDLDDESVNFRKAAEELFGPGAYDALLEQTTQNCTKIVDEIIEYKADIGSK